MQKNGFFSLSAAVFALTAMTLHAAPETVIASSFGFDKANATQCLQNAINSGAKKVIVDNTGSPWIVTPIKMASNQEVVLQDGVVIAAMPDAFKHRSDCLISFTQVSNTTLRGEGTAILKMNKADYQDTKRYEWAEWRHTVSIAGSQNIVVKDLTILSSGGDGVYVRGNGIPASKNILLENLICKDHHRQGISVISAEDLLVRKCQFLATRGTPPQCGIDIEPNRPTDRIINNVFEDCIFNDNAASGIDLYLTPLNATTKPLSVVFRNCISKNNGNKGIIITASRTTPVKGTVLFENCTIAENRHGALNINAQQPDGLEITFKNCSFDNEPSTNTPFVFAPAQVQADFTGVHFQNCTLNPGNVKTPMEFIPSSGYGLLAMDGDVTLPDGSKLDFPELVKNNPPKPELRNFKTDDCNLKNVKLFPNALKSKKHANIITRNEITIIQYFPKAGNYDITFTPRQISKGGTQVVVNLLDAAGNAMNHIEFPGKEPYTYTHNAKGPGFVQYEVIKGQGMIVSSTAPWGYLVNKRLALFRGKAHDFYFVAPAGLQKVTMEVYAQLGEPLDAALVNAKGETVVQEKNVRGAHILIAQRPNDAPDEIWTLRLTNIVEDHAIRFGSGILPIAATDPQNVFILNK